MIAKKHIAWLLMFVLFSTSATASEFGNIFGNEGIERQSRAASADALKALESIFQGLRIRELQEASGEKEFREAARLLSSAASQMLAIIESEDFPTFSLSAEEAQLLDPEIAQNWGFSEVKEGETNHQIYQHFAKATFDMSSLIGELALTDQPIYPAIADRLQAYLAFGTAVTEINLMIRR